jgi:hypothetical protein
VNFEDIPQFPRAHYEVNISWRDIERSVIRDYDPQLILEPDYQRGNVWNPDQQMAFVEYGLMGGESSMVITTNCPGWMDDFRGPWELVDGLQRVTAVRKFIANELRAFGHLYSEFGDQLGSLSGPSFRMRVLSLPTRAEVLKLYLLLNSGGVVHSPAELERVKALLAKEGKGTR